MIDYQDMGREIDKGNGRTALFRFGSDLESNIRKSVLWQPGATLENSKVLVTITR